MAVRLPAPGLILLIGPPASGKSTWAEAHFRADHIVSSDRLRALVGEGEHDQRASTDAFDILDVVLERRLKRRLLTVVDTLGTDAKRRRRWLDLARSHHLPVVAVVFDLSPEECRARNRARASPVPARVLAAQLQSWPATRRMLEDEGFDAIVTVDAAVTVDAGGVDIVPDALLNAPAHALRQQEDPVSLDFGLQIPKFSWPGGPTETRDRLKAIALAAEDAGFGSLWVMDHFLQIPHVGREWEDMLDSYTTLGYLAGVTERIRLGTLVTGITYRNVAHLAKIVATLDVVSGGRAWCGVGAAWFEREHQLYGWRFPPRQERFHLLEDALQLLPLMWGPGSPAFEGQLVSVSETICYPRPLQEKVPILIGGSGERRTLRLVAQYADACNLFGDAGAVAHKVEVLNRHCKDVGRDPADILVSHLATALVAPNSEELQAAVESLRPARSTPEAYAAAVNAGTVADQVGRYRQLADAGVQLAIVNMPDLVDASAIERFAPIIDSFR